MSENKLEVGSLVLIRLGGRIQVIGELVEADNPDRIFMKGILQVAGQKIMRYDKDQKSAGRVLVDLTEADKVSQKFKQEDLRTVPVLSVPDESITTSCSMQEAIDKVWVFSARIFDSGVPVAEKSLLHRFYTVTIKELLENRKLGRRMFQVCDLSDDVAKALYDEELAAKIFG